MKRRIIILGFPKEISEELKNFSLATQLEVETVQGVYLSHYPETGPTENEKSVFKEIKDIFLKNAPFDIVLLSSTALKGTLLETINFIKNFSPLTEIILISFEQNYRTAVMGFRAGVRDILDYPFSLEVFSGALKKSFNYQSILQKSKSFSEMTTLLNMFGDARNFRSTDDFLKKLEGFFVQNIKSSSLVVLRIDKTLPKESSLDQFDAIVWNEMAFKREFQIGNTLSFLKEVYLGYFEEHQVDFLCKTIVHSEERFHFFVLNFGPCENSLHFGLFFIKTLNHDLKLFFNSLSTPWKEEGVMKYFSNLIFNLYQQTIYSSLEEKLATLVHTDDVTGLFNQRKLQLDLDFCIHQYHHLGEKFFIYFIDIDNFKKVNDGHGHLIGSQLLVEVGRVLKRTLRETDLIYRYGGDEFVVIIRNIDHDVAKLIGDRILKVIAERKFSFSPEEDLSLSVSIGIAEFPKDASNKDEVLSLADKMMYHAKESGRGRVCMARE